MRTLTFFLAVCSASLALAGCGGSVADDTDSTSPASGSGGSGASGSGGAAGAAGASAGAAGASAGAAGASAGAAGASAGAGGTSAGSGGAAGGGGSVAGGSGGGSLGGVPVAYAFDTIDLGEAPQAWKTLGENIDGLSFPTSTTPGHCKPLPGAKPGDVVVDGSDGIDNSFARNIIPMFVGLGSSFPADVAAALQSGKSSYVIALGEEQAQLYGVKGTTSASGKPVAPDDWSSYVWHPLSPYVADPASPQPTSLFQHVVVAEQGTWSSTERADAAPLTLPFFGSSISVPLHRARIVITPGPGGTAKGYISAVVPTAELLQSVALAAGAVSPSLCKGSTLQGVLDQLAMASDMMVDGTQDPTQVCNAISIGIGFTAKAGKIGASVPLLAPATCGG